MLYERTIEEDLIWNQSVLKAWEKFIQDGQIDLNIPSYIIESWKRCKQFNLDPFAKKVAGLLNKEEFDIVKKNKNQLIEIAKPYVDLIYKCVQGSGFLSFLADENGIILYLVGDKEPINYFRKYNLVEGACWSEKYAGTNAVGTSLVLGKPLQIFGCQHFCALQHSIACSCSPIFGKNGKIIGALNISGEVENVHSHTLGMVIATAKAIENELKILKALNEIRNRESIIKTTLENIPKGIITVDSNYKVTQINPYALNIIGVEKKIEGKFIEDIFQSKPKITNILKLKKVINEEIILENDPYIECHLTSAPFFNDQGEYSGSILIIQSSEEVNKLVNKVIGAHASFNFDSIIGESKEMVRAKSIAKTVAKSDATVLLLGESGTGKELFAQSIHSDSKREGAFIAVNCSAIPKSLIESELFGYEAGSFTGANRNGRPGKFERAQGGTIFLDEIGDMPLDLQAVLLRVLQEKKVIRVGGYKPIPIDVRVVAATNKNLRRKVEEESFREDLYFRLNVITVNIPPLRERKDDILITIKKLLPKICIRLNKNIMGISDETIKILMQYDWPGNVRELENVLERCVLISDTNTITTKCLPSYIIENSNKEEQINKKIMPLREVEKKAIIDAIKKEEKISNVAKELRISRSTLYRKIREYDILIN